MSKVITKDVLIIGAGPVGLYAASQCGLMNLSSVVIDCLDFAGGQCAALYPQKPIYDIPAYPSITAEDLVAKLLEQNKRFNPEYLLSSKIIDLQKDTNAKQEDLKFTATTDNDYEIKTKTVIVAAGAGFFGPNKPPIENIDQYEDKSLFYYVKEKSIFKNKKIVILGGGDSALDWAIDLSDIAKEVHLIHRRDKFRALESSVKQMRELVKQGKIILQIPYQIKNIKGSGEQITSAIIGTTKGETKEIECDAVLSFFGLKSSLGPVNDWGLDIETHKITIKDPTTMRTNIDGIYAIGDVANYSNKHNMIMVGFSESYFASYDIIKYLNPDQHIKLEHSTSNPLVSG